MTMDADLFRQHMEDTEDTLVQIELKLLRSDLKVKLIAGMF